MSEKNKLSRRKFLKNTSLVSSGLFLTKSLSACSKEVSKKEIEQLKEEAISKDINTKYLNIALIGCGKRGIEALKNAFDSDKRCRLYSICDLYIENTNQVLKEFRVTKYEKFFAIDSKRIFIGFDAYKKAINLKEIDIVILATPPKFRPYHLNYSVSKNKHIFAEKPWFVDSVGAKITIDTMEKAKKKKLTVISGLVYRYKPTIIKTITAINNGEIGDVKSLFSTYYTSAIDYKGAFKGIQEQLKNWNYYTWLSGDHIVEQAIHSIDRMLWVLGNIKPLYASASGGKISTYEKKYGNTYDHFDVKYHFEDDVVFHLSTRMINNVDNKTEDFIIGTRGTAEILTGKIKSYSNIEKQYNQRSKNMYLLQWESLFDSIRKEKARNDADHSINSNLVALMGRYAAYTGKFVQYNDILKLKDNLGIKKYDFSQPQYIENIPRPGKNYL